jgi:hypothetical protein
MATSTGDRGGIVNLFAAIWHLVVLVDTTLTQAMAWAVTAVWTGSVWGVLILVAAMVAFSAAHGIYWKYRNEKEERQ